MCQCYNLLVSVPGDQEKVKNCSYSEFLDEKGGELQVRNFASPQGTFTAIEES